MHISISIPIENTVTTHGYGVAAQGMVTALQALGHRVTFQDSTAPVEINFSQPTLWRWSSKTAHHIGYVPWESTRIPQSWLGPMQAADEVWTTSPWCKWVYERSGIENVHVYEHGVDSSVWTRKRRRPENHPGGREIRFLHMGEPAPRKGGQQTFDLFTELFSGRDDVSLTIKANGYNTIRGKDGTHPTTGHPNVKMYTHEYEEHQLVDLVRRHDVLLYPSYGEGFGLIPLQAMVTGMPVICTSAWAPYNSLLVPELRLDSKLVKSPWPDVHPGNMYEPDFDQLKKIMEQLVDGESDYADASARAYRNSFAVETKYDWLAQTESAFSHIVERFS